MALALTGLLLACGPAGAARRGDTLDILEFGTSVGQGNPTADTAALVAVLEAARKAPGSTIDLPAGHYHFAAPASPGYVIPTHTTLRGAGMGRTRVSWDDAPGTNLFVTTVVGGVRPADITVQDLTITGTSDRPENAGSGGGYPLHFSGVDGLVIDHVTSEYSRAMGIVARASTDVAVSNSVVRFAFSDGISVTGDSGVIVTGNLVEHGQDDCISAHSDIHDPQRVRRGLVISANRCFDTQGIKVLAARQAVITGNTLDAVRAQGIMVSTCAADDRTCSGGAEAFAAAMSIVISSNSISNVINRQHVDNANQGNPGIAISGGSARAGSARYGSNGAIPGEADARSGAIGDPYREALANSAAPDTPTPGTYGIVIASNVIARTLPASDGSDPRFPNWSSFGFGAMWTKRGWVDPHLSEADLQGSGIRISGGVVRDVLVTGNILRGLANGLSLGEAARLDNIVFRGNQVVDCAQAGVVVNSAAAIVAQVEDNLFDLDPFNKSADRGPHGTWQKPGGPTGIQQQRGGGLQVRRNVFRNMGRLASQPGQGAGAGYLWDDNVIEADPVALGYDPRNAGIGLVPDDGTTRLVQLGSDPGNAATFGRILAVGAPVADKRPTSGAWLPGAFVRAARPQAAGGQLLLGWLRRTVGAANAETDWTELYASTK